MASDFQKEAWGFKALRPREKQTGDLGKAIWDLIHGVGGMAEYTVHEWVEWHDDDHLSAAHWLVRCLANPDCEEGTLIFEAITDRREELKARNR